MKSISYKLRWRRRPSCLKKGVFCMQEGHVLKRRRRPFSLTPSPSLNGEGSDHRDTPTCPPHDSYVFSSYQQPNRGNLTYYSPLHSERGWGWGLCVLCMPKAFCEFETVRYYVLLNLWVLWEINLPSKSHRHYLIEWVRSISHRITQNNRTHSISQRH